MKIIHFIMLTHKLIYSNLYSITKFQKEIKHITEQE